MSEISRFPVSVVPNAGIPDEEGVYPESPEMLADILASFVNEKWVNLIGGCCGTTVSHIHALATLVEGVNPRCPSTDFCSRISGIETLVIDDDEGPYIVGERTNVIGSRHFKKMIEAEQAANDLLISTKGNQLPKDCMGCYLENQCAGGFLPTRYSKENGFDNTSVYCNGIKQFFDLLKEKVSPIIQENRV